MDLELGGKVAVVTGASKGIGLAVVRALAEEGAEVIAGARTVDTLVGLERVSAFEVDLARPAAPSSSSTTRSSGTGMSMCSSTTWARCSCGWRGF